MASQTLLALLAAIVLTAVHLLSGRLRFLGGVPRSAWLSAFGGISVAYVFMHLLPELAEGQKAIEGAGGDEAALLGFLEHHVYLMALLGLIVFYGVERHSRGMRAAATAARTARTTTRSGAQQVADDRVVDGE